MSSEAAQKAYPDTGDVAMKMWTAEARAHFDAGAVEALRQAAQMLQGGGMYAEYWDGQRVEYVKFERSPNDRTPATVLNRMADEWVVGQ